MIDEKVIIVCLDMIDAKVIDEDGTWIDESDKTEFLTKKNFVGFFDENGEKLSQIYGESPYTQQQAEQEIFNLANAAEAAKKRKRLAQLEQASFSGSSGISSGALRRERSISGTPQAYGAGQY